MLLADWLLDCLFIRLPACLRHCTISSVRVTVCIYVFTHTHEVFFFIHLLMVWAPLKWAKTLTATNASITMWTICCYNIIYLYFSCRSPFRLYARFIQRTVFAVLLILGKILFPNVCLFVHRLCVLWFKIYKKPIQKINCTMLK